MKANNAALAFAGSLPDGKVIWISISLAVLSSIFLILTLPFSDAEIIESITDCVVVSYGISVIVSWLTPVVSIRALTFTFPPLSPPLYSDVSARPPVGKSGSRTKSSFLRADIERQLTR